MAENTQMSREELEAELARRNTPETTPEPPAQSTRERSPIKPQDHKPADHEKVTFEFAGETFTMDARAPKDSRVFLSVRKGDLEPAIIRMTSAEDLERLLKAIEDEDGWSDMEQLGKFVDAAHEAAGTKNS
ncbi:hypothetical protein Leucomu_03635 [Leucobacter muris]|uniref:Tail assembly chaperone n=1 Tax=Leucobacter muris TaxID=1935379 RepID=A0ABX5QDJ3_9MICO|nr:hypothetical protein [Leucobacter muris]QAB17134.1 hypothetical protein Leucomu_03635 [Leucobacter muris]